MAMAGPGIATITSTRLDSASKHQIAVRVDYEHMLSWVGYDAQLLMKEKMKWCLHKDDLAIGCSRPIRSNEPKRTSARNKAYPSVVCTLAQMEDAAINYLVALYHNSRTFAERDVFVNQIEKGIDKWVGRIGKTDVAKKQIQEMPDFYFVGVSVGLAYAHPNSGDNMCTSMMGGMKTVMNGAFDIQGGDLVHWYWDVEQPCFTESGARVKERIKGSEGFSPTSAEDVSNFLVSHHAEPGERDERRRKYHARENGNFSAPMYDGNITGKLRVALPKPFRYQDDEESIYDRLRIFGRAVTSARRFEMVDIMINRQCL